ncbi:hypothetical protein BJX99DRAFT_214442 [Aspergillus californicus]
MGRSKKIPAKILRCSDRIAKRATAKEQASKQVAAVLSQELEYDPHGSYGILHYVSDHDEPLDEQVKHLKDRVRDLEIFVRNTMRTAEFLTHDFMEFGTLSPSEFPGEMDMIYFCTRNWAENWSGKDVASLTGKQKKQVVTALDGYLVQEDLDAIHGRLHPKLQPRFRSVLTETLLNKTVIDTFFRHVFWYVDEDVQPGDNNDQVIWDGVSSFGEKLGNLHTQLQSVNNEYAQVWRSATTRLCNSTTKGPSFGTATQAGREARCLAFAKHLLDDEVFSSLLEPTDTPDQRLAELAHKLQAVSKIVIDMQAQTPLMAFHTLEDLNNRFSPSSDTMEPYAYCFAKCDGKTSRLDGHRVLAITRPYIFRTVNDPEHEKDIEPVLKAEALLEEELTADEKKSPAGTGRRAKKPKA